MSNTTKLTTAEATALKTCLNYDDRQTQLEDNYSNGGMNELMQALNWNQHQVAALTGSLEKKGYGVWDEEGADIFWILEDGIHAIFDHMEAEASATA